MVGRGQPDEPLFSAAHAEHGLGSVVPYWFDAAVDAHRKPVGTEAEQELLLMTSRKLVQAGEALDAADEAEEFQAVGMQCRECLPALIRELTEDGQFDEAGEMPKKADFKAWADRIAGVVAAGGSAEHVRSYLKKIADETWQLTIG